MIKILLADNQLLTREGIVSVITSVTGIQIIANITDASTLKQAILNLNPDVVMVDYTYIPTLYNGDNNELDNQLNPGLFLLLFNKADAIQVISLRDQGVRSYLCKETTQTEVLQAIRDTANGKEFFCSCTTELLSDKKGDTNPLLSLRETEIIHLIADGLTNNEIADKLFLSYHTIKTHRKNIIKKLGFTFKNTAELSSFIKSQKP